jgi:hypothetical protein
MLPGLPPVTSHESPVTFLFHSSNFGSRVYFVILAMKAEYGSIATVPLAGGSAL